MFPAVLANQPGGLAMVPGAIGGDAPANVVQQRCGLENEPVVVIQAVEIFQSVEELERQRGDVPDVVWLFLERLHQSQDLFTRGGQIHLESSNAPKRKPCVLTWSASKPRCTMTVS